MSIPTMSCSVVRWQCVHERAWHCSGGKGLPWHLSLSSHAIACGSRLVEGLRSTWACLLVGQLEVGRQWRRGNPTCNCSPGVFREGGEIGGVSHQS